jgi:hypothetical protein
VFAFMYVLALSTSLLSGETTTKSDTCTCSSIKRIDGWCGKCEIGYLAGVRIESAKFFDALDAHGHDIDPALLRCDRCRKNYESHGFCDECKIGFVRKQAYFSRPTYYLARGEVRDAGSITCPTCLKNTEGSGWCAKCRVGMVGFHAYRDEQEFATAARARENLIAAIELAKTCLSCALAAVNDGKCLPCKTTFKDGKKIQASPPER